MKDVVSALGAVLTEDLRKKNTHLICMDGSGAKYERALQWRIPVVNIRWLFACVREGRVVDCQPYLVRPALGSTSDIPVTPLNAGDSFVNGTPVAMDVHERSTGISVEGQTDMAGTCDEADALPEQKMDVSSEAGEICNIDGAEGAQSSSSSSSSSSKSAEDALRPASTELSQLPSNLTPPVMDQTQDQTGSPGS